jgi:hypothetical protein
MQTDSIVPAERKYRTVPQTARLLWAEGGAARFTAGLVPCLMRSFPGTSAAIARFFCAHCLHACMHVLTWNALLLCLTCAANAAGFLAYEMTLKLFAPIGDQ